MDNKPDNNVTMNHIDEDINKDIKELEENMIFLYPNKDDNKPTLSTPYIRKKIINEPKKDNSIDIVQPNEKDNSLFFPIKQSNIEYGSHIIYEPSIFQRKITMMLQQIH